jgi:hypothetical protein
MRRETLGLRVETSIIYLIELVLTGALLTLLTACGSSSKPPSIAVTASTTTVDGGDSVTLTAAVTNDKNSNGVTWSVSGGGTLSSETTSSATYTAPAATTSAQTVTITATSVADTSKTATQTLTVPAEPSITTTSLAAGQVGAAYSATLAGSGGISPYTWSLSSGTLPSGLSLAASTGVISGTPLAAGVGTANLTFKLTDSGTATALTATQTLSLTIAPTTTAIAFSTTTLAAATYNTAYSATVAASGGVGTLSYSLASGALPGGLKLSTSGAITGTPNATGTFSFTVTAADAYGDSATSGTLQIAVSYAALSITSKTLPSGVINTAYSTTLSAAGGSGSYTWALTSGSLPTGISSLTTAGLISGTPTATGTFTFTATVTDSVTSKTASATLSIAIYTASLSVTTGTTLPAGTVNTAYSQTLNASGGSGTGYTWAVASGSSLPSWLSLTSSTGVLSGTPTTATTYSFIITVTDSASNTASATFSLTINGSLSITTTTLPAATENVLYSQTIGVSGGTQPYTFSISSGSLPSWASTSTFDSSGKITGTPTSTGSTTFTVEVTDSSSHTATQQLTLTVYAASGVNDALLKGNYAFVGSGWVDGATEATTYKMAVIGSFAADGNGNITSGVIDANKSGVGVLTDEPITGTYNIASSDTGFLTFTTAGGNTTTLAISVGAISSSVATAGSVIEYDDSTGIGTAGGQRGAGQFALQTTSTFTTASLNGGYVFGMDGETCRSGVASCPTTSTAYGPLSVAGVATFSGAGAISTGEEDVAVGATQYSAVSLSGSYGTPNATTGRVVATLNPSSGIDSNEQAIWPTDFVYYIVNSGELYVMSIDSGATYASFAGTAVQQSQSSFSSSNFSGNIVLWESAPDSSYVSNFGTSSETSSSEATLLFITVSNSSASGTQYKNDNGTYSTHSASATVSVASNGRVTLTGSSNPPVFYLSGTNTGYGTETTDSGDNPGLLTFIGQSGTSFSNSTLSGNFIGINPLPVPDTTANTGITDFSSGSLTSTGYKSDYDGNLAADTGTDTFTVDASTGVLTSPDGVGIIISPTYAVYLSSQSANPSIQFFFQ